MYRLITSPNFKFISSNDSSFIPNTYSTLATILGKQSKFKEVIEVANIGIEHCNKFQTSSALSTLFLVKAYALQDLGRNEEALECARKVLMLLFVEGNTEKLSKFQTLLENRLQVKISI